MSEPKGSALSAERFEVGFCGEVGSWGVVDGPAIGVLWGGLAIGVMWDGPGIGVLWDGPGIGVLRNGVTVRMGSSSSEERSSAAGSVSEPKRSATGVESSSSDEIRLSTSFISEPKGPALPVDRFEVGSCGDRSSCFRGGPKTGVAGDRGGMLGNA